MKNLLACLVALAGYAMAAGGPRISLIDADSTGWTGLDAAGIAGGGLATFRYPEGSGLVKRGFQVHFDGAEDWRGYEGLELDLEVEGEREAELGLTVVVPAGLSANERVSGTVRFRGSRKVFVSWHSLDYPRARNSWLKFVRGFDLAPRYTDGRSGRIVVKSVDLVKAPAMALECGVRGRSVAAGGMAEYRFAVINASTEVQSVDLKLENYGWQAMIGELEESSFQLKPGETREIGLKVGVPDKLPPGASEKQTVRVTGNGNAALSRTMDFITGVEVPAPYILHNAARWQEVRDKVKHHEWARRERDKYVKMAEKWVVPEVAKPPGNDPDDTWGPYLFSTRVEHDLMACGISWQLTGEKQYAEKVALFLRRLSDPETGYPKTLRGCNQSQVQEGHFFQHIAMAYDMVRDAGVIGDGDRKQIEETFRLFLQTMSRYFDSAPINNWNVAEAIGAFYCALAMQDLAEVDRWFAGPAGICDQLRIGTMDDGWWYECSISYNTWVAREFTQVALAYEPWGVKFKEMRLPATYSPNVLLNPELNGGGAFHPRDPEQLEKPFGMDPEVYGPLRRPWRAIRDLWDSLIPFIDWRGVMFGVNDSTENLVIGPRPGTEPSPFEVAYYVFRDPAYASIIKRGTSRDLLYGVPDLPEDTPEPFRDSASADNVGLAMLRSHAPDRPIREQIQAVLHYGTHGWAHGHFDRTNLLSLMRYGRSFYNPEMVWHSYEPFMYKFYVQTSVSKNMVVVDRKMQKATPGERLIFHTGSMMQATAVETTAPWGNPPYGGMVYDYVPVKTFEEKTWREGRHVPIPDNQPNYGEITEYTEPIHQRRVMVVTDDYVLLADDVKGDAPHEFESLFQMKGFLGLEAEDRKFLRHDAQWDANPLGSAQFVTDCDRYEVSAPAVSRFEMKFGPGADNAGTRAPYSEDGVLKLDVHTLWPPKHEIMYGTAPEDHGLGQRLFYKVKGDGKVLAKGKFGAWTLGKGEIDVPLEGVKHLELETRTERKKRPTLFWGSARVVMADGSEVPLSEFSVTAANVRQVKTANLDYDGGPVKIQGEAHAFSTPAQPADDSKPGVVRVDLSGVKAVRLKSVIGSDFPPGPEAQRRKTMAVKAPKGEQARFITIIEPYENDAVVKSAVAVSDSKVRVELVDGREQEITLSEHDGAPSVEIVESRDGAELRRESTH